MKIKVISEIDEAKKLLQRKLEEQISVIFAEEDEDLRIRLELEDYEKNESYRFDFVADQEVKISGSDKMGLLHGIGKFLHSAKWDEEAFCPVSCPEWQSPDCSFRAIYFALHFYNWYHMASYEEQKKYLEDLILYGYNTVLLILPIINSTDFNGPVYQGALKLEIPFYQMAKKLGMKTGILICVNQGLKSMPHEYDALYNWDPEPPKPIVRGNAGRNLCYHKEGALEYMRSIWKRQFADLKEVGLDYVVTWPYDEGGCGCPKCYPWGGNAFLDLSKYCYDDMKEIFPNAQMVISTWTFDKNGENAEYDGLYKRLKEDLKDISYLMVDDHEEFPTYPLEHDIRKPIINFPEISMWKLWPWGGYGANPLPKRFETFFKSAEKVLQGGAPYSEGIYEDISKVECVGFYWNKNATYREILEEYANFEFGTAVKEKAVRLMELIEINHVAVGRNGEADLGISEEAADLAREIDSMLFLQKKNAWRWRILYIRAILDEKRYRVSAGMSPSDVRHITGRLLKDDEEAQEMFWELRKLYHCVPYNGENRSTLPPADGEVNWD